jgi:hypothetical protein
MMLTSDDCNERAFIILTGHQNERKNCVGFDVFMRKIGEVTFRVFDFIQFLKHTFIFICV